MGNPTTNAKKKIFGGLISGTIAFALMAGLPTVVVASDSVNEAGQSNMYEANNTFVQNDESTVQSNARLKKEKKAYRDFYKNITKKYKKYLTKSNKLKLKKDLKKVNETSDINVVISCKERAKSIKISAKLKKAKVKYNSVVEKLNSSKYSWCLTVKQKKAIVKYTKEVKKTKMIGDVQDLTKKADKILSKAKKKSKNVKYKKAPLSNRLTKSKGVNYFNGRRETFYTPYEETGSVHTPYHFDSNGIGRDPQGYVIVAASDLRRGTLIMTSWGMGKVWDCGCAYGTNDIFTCWA